MQTLKTALRLWLLALTLALPLWATPIELGIEADFKQSSKQTFVQHRQPYTLAIDLPNEPYEHLRLKLQQSLGFPLRRFEGWKQTGESHLTVVTPPEYNQVLSRFLSEDEIDGIAKSLELQQSDIVGLGLGTGQVTVQGEVQQTFFLIADSSKARQVRHAIHQAYVSKGGRASDWDPSWYFPHVTVGFTHSDIHEHQGLLKSIKHSWDHRFLLIPSP